MFNIAICDTQPDIDTITQYVKTFCKDKLPCCNIQTFSMAQTLDSQIMRGARFDLYLIDIKLDIFSNINLGKLIYKSDKSAPIIFLLTKQQLPSSAEHIKPLGYIFKPFEYQQFSETLRDIMITIPTTQDKHFIKTDRGEVAILNSQICFCEFVQRKLIYHLVDGSIVKSYPVKGTFVESAPWASDPNCCFCHRSYAINFDNVKIISKSSFVMANTEDVPIAKNLFPQVKQAYLEYIANKNSKNN